MIILLLGFYEFRASHFKGFSGAVSADVFASYAVLIFENSNKPAVFSVENPTDGSKRFAEIVNVRNLS